MRYARFAGLWDPAKVPAFKHPSNLIVSKILIGLPSALRSQEDKLVRKPTQSDDQPGGQPSNLMERIASVQLRARVISTEATLSEAELKAFMDEQWAENS